MLKKLAVFCILFLIAITVSACSDINRPNDRLQITPSSGILDFMYSYPGSFGNFNSGLLVVENTAGDTLIINAKGEPAITLPANITINGEFSEGMLAVVDKQTRLAGFVDTNGEMAISCQYNGVSFFSDGLAYVEFADGDRGYINNSGDTIITDVPYVSDAFGEELTAFSEGMAQFSTATGIGFIDKSGNIVVGPQLVWARTFQDGLAVVKKADGLFYYMDKLGKPLTSSEYISAGDFSEGFAPVTTMDGVSGVINKSGELIFTHPYSTGSSYSDGLSRVSNQEGKIGYMDTSGNLAIPFSNYTWGSNYSEGVALVGIESPTGYGAEDRYGYINKQGVLLTELKYNLLSRDFHEGHALAVIDHEDYATEILQLK